MFFEHVLQLPAELSLRRAFRPPGEGDGHRHQHAVEPVAGVLPRALRQHRLAPRAAAGHAVRQLALRPAADRAVLRVRGADLLHHFAERKAAGQGRALLQRRVGANHRHARQHRAGAELHPHRERSARHAKARRGCARRAAPGAVVVGAGNRDHPHGNDVDDPGHPHARRVVLRPRSHHRGRDRHVHELCDASDRQARAGRRLCQPHGDGRAAAARVLRRARHDAVGARPAGRGRSRPAARADRIQGRVVTRTTASGLRWRT